MPRHARQRFGSRSVNCAWVYVYPGMGRNGPVGRMRPRPPCYTGGPTGRPERQPVTPKDPSPDSPRSRNRPARRPLPSTDAVETAPVRATCPYLLGGVLRIGTADSHVWAHDYATSWSRAQTIASALVCTPSLAYSRLR